MSAKPNAPAPSAPIIETAPATPIEAFLDKHFRNIAYGVLGLIAASAVYGVVQYRGKQAALEAAIAATAAKTVDDCAIVATKYKGSVAGGNALLTKAKLLWQDNKKDSAIATLREFKANYASHPFFTQGVLALATRLETLGANEAKESQSIYEDIVKNNKDSDIAGLAQMRLGDLLWSQGKEDEAKKIYEELPRKFPGQFFDENQKRLDWIAAALPTKEVDAPKIPDAIKAPATPGAPGTGSAPAINLTPGKSGIPATSAPFEVKMNPPAPGGAATGKPTINVQPSGAAPTINVQPSTKPNITIQPSAPSSALNPSGAPAPTKSATPELKIEPKPLPQKVEIKPLPTAPAPSPAPAAPAKADEAPKK